MSQTEINFLDITVFEVDKFPVSAKFIATANELG